LKEAVNMLTQSPAARHFQWPLQQVVLEGYSVRLTPVDYSHLDQLSVWSAEEDIWRYMTFAHLASKDELQAWIGTAMDANERGTEMNFAIIDEASQSAVGTTSLYRVVPEHERLELGKTWLGAAYRRTHINTAAKYLMLKHAFETLLTNRVELNTDARNVRSQRAMERPVIRPRGYAVFLRKAASQGKWPFRRRISLESKADEVI
jgi:RimJ/RimL family protein N-acetyltransferase